MTVAPPISLLRLGKSAATIVGFISAVVSLVLIVGGETFRANYALHIVLYSAHWALIIFLLQTLLEVRHQTGLWRPKVHSYIQKYNSLLTYRVEWLGVGQHVSIYIQEGKFERFACLGEVTNIQDDGFCQIRCYNISHGDTAAISDFLSGTDVENILVKPGANSRAIQ